MPKFFRKLCVPAIAGIALLFAAVQASAAVTPKRVQVKGEIIDTWCYITGIMFAEGTAHYNCAVWCAVGGIPVSILGEDGKVYVILRVEDDEQSVTSPSTATIQAHTVSVDGDLYEKDGVNYLFITQVKDNHGIVKLTHRDIGGISPGFLDKRIRKQHGVKE